MGSKFKSVVLLGVFVLVPLCVSSCSSDDSADKNKMEQNKNLTISNVNLEKTWIVSHFQFTDNCSKEARLKYQLSVIHLDLKEGQYFSTDQYSLEKDEGTWSLDGDMIKMKSSLKEHPELKFKITELGRNEMKATLIDHNDLLTIELVAK